MWDLQVATKEKLRGKSEMWGKRSSLVYLFDLLSPRLPDLNPEHPWRRVAPLSSSISCCTCDIGAGLSVFSIDYNVFRAFIGGPLESLPSCITGDLFLEHTVEYILQNSHPCCLSAVFRRPLDTVWHFQVPSFLCLGWQPLNGVINVSPKGNFHSQLPKETVSCDAFLLDINRSREGQVMEGKQAESMHQPTTGCLKQASKNRISFYFQQRCS